MNMTSLQEFRAWFERLRPDAHFAMATGVLAILVASAMFAIIYRHAQTDILAHITHYNEGTPLSYPIWHWSMDSLATLTPVSQLWSAAVVNFIFTFAAFVATLFYLTRNTDLLANQITIIWVALGLIILGPLYFPYVSRHMLYGTGSPNVWHNPTYYPLRFTAILCFTYMVLYLEKPRNRTLLLIGAVLFLSIFSKPSFALSIIPALFLNAALAPTRFEPRSYLLPMMCLAIACPGLFIQYMVLYGEENIRDASITIAPFFSWRLYTNSVLLSFISALLFPLLTTATLFWHKIPLGTGLRLSWLNLLVALTAYILFAEISDGVLTSDGNFAWTYFVAMGLVFLAALVSLMQHQQMFKPAQRSRLWSAFIVHVGFGILYLVKINIFLSAA